MEKFSVAKNIAKKVVAEKITLNEISQLWRHMYYEIKKSFPNYDEESIRKQVDRLLCIDLIEYDSIREYCRAKVFT